MKSDKGIFGRLKEEHREVADLFERLMETTNDDLEARGDLFERLRANLLAHSNAEQAEVYPRLEQMSSDLADGVADGVEEHDEVEDLLESIEEMDFDDEDWLSSLQELKETVEHHVSDEENEIFPEAKKHMDETDAEEMEERYLTAKEMEMEELTETAGITPAGLDDLSKEELYERAKKLDIPGRSQMSKAQLIREIRNH